MQYSLTQEDIETVARAITMRIWISADLGLNHATTYKRDLATRVREEYAGAAAELAWAQLNGDTWHNPINEFHHIPDTGNYEIRATEHPRGGLIIRDNDPDDRIYIFATVHDHRCHFHGWAYGYEAKNDKHLWNPHGYRQAWRMDRKELRPLMTLEHV